MNSKGNNNNPNTLEKKYEEIFCYTYKQFSPKYVKLMLPIKTKDGQIEKQPIKKIDSKENFDRIEHKKKRKKSSLNNYLQVQNIINLDRNKPITAVQLLASHKKKVKLLQYEIGILSSEVLEFPEEKLKNLSILLNFMEEKYSETYIMIQKLATASLLEIFKDLLPSYKIKLRNKDKTKLKNETLRLQNYETTILKYYKEYLQKLEIMAIMTKNEKHKVFFKEDLHLGSFAINCMGLILVNHQYFNFSTNIANFLIPFLNSKYEPIRQIVKNCFEQIFKEDNCGELSLSIIRHLYQYLKKQTYLVHVEVISILLSINIKDTDLSINKCDLYESKNDFSRKNIKKKEKKNNNLVKIKNKLLETKQSFYKQENLKKISKIKVLVFKIYFIVLKIYTSSLILSSCLEGLTKFSHYINGYFQKELINILDTLLQNKYLTIKERLDCIRSIFIISSNKTSILNIDFNRFSLHFYKILFDIHIGRNCTEINIFIKILIEVFIYKRKHISKNCLLACIKRICIITLTLGHNEALGILYIISEIMYSYKLTNVLLDSDYNIGEGIYLPEINSPEYCNAYCTSLWEMIALQRHYNTILKNVAKSITYENDEYIHILINLFESTAEKKYKNYTSKGLFQPKIVVPRILFLKNIFINTLMKKLEKKITYIKNVEKVTYINLHKYINKKIKL